MNLEDVITLDNGKHYLLLEEMEYEYEKYFLAVEVKEDEILYSNFKFFLEEKENGEFFVEEIDDIDVIRNLTLIASTSQLIDKYPELEDKILEELEGDKVA